MIQAVPSKSNSYLRLVIRPIEGKYPVNGISIFRRTLHAMRATNKNAMV